MSQRREAPDVPIEPMPSDPDGAGESLPSASNAGPSLPWNLPGALLASIAIALLLALSPLPRIWALLAGSLLASLLPLAFIIGRLWKHGVPLHSLYENTFKFSNTPLLITDHKNRVVALNQAFEELLEQHHESKTGQPIETHLPESWLEHFKADRPSGRSVRWKAERTLPWADGEPRTILLDSTRIAPPGAPPITLTACIDISLERSTRRRQTELRQNTENFVQHLINVIPHPVYVRDAQSRYKLVNEAFAELYERRPEDIVGLSPEELLHDEPHAKRTMMEDQEVLEGRRIFKEVSRPYGLHGEPRSIVVSKGACLDSKKEKVIVGAHFDVTRWRQAERELKEALEREVERRENHMRYLQRLIDVIPHPFYVKDRYSRCLIGNKAFARLQGCGRSALPGQPTTQRLTPQRASEIHREDAEVLTGGAFLREEFGLRFATDKTPRYRAVSKGACLDPDREPVIVCAVVDVTDWRLAEARWMEAKESADRANEAKSLFLANMSHELRTPMHAILSFARLGQARTQNDEAVSKENGYFDRIIRSGERLLNLLNDLLDLAKLEEGHKLKDQSHIDLKEIVQDTLSEFAALMDSRLISLDLHREGETVAWCSASMMGQVIRNLLSNAVKFSPEGGKLRLFLGQALLQDKTGGREIPAIEIRVSDQGPGIPEAELETVFDKFVQSSKTHSGAGGTGLGLSICREIVSLHQGEIFARTPAGGGAEFVVRLPTMNLQEALIA